MQINTITIGLIFKALTEGRADDTLISMIVETLTVADQMLDEAANIYDYKLDHVASELTDCFDALGEFFE